MWKVDACWEGSSEMEGTNCATWRTRKGGNRVKEGVGVGMKLLVKIIARN